MGRSSATEKTKCVLKPVKQWEQCGNMHNWKFRNFLNKNHPTLLPSLLGTLLGKGAKKHLGKYDLFPNRWGGGVAKTKLLFWRIFSFIRDFFKEEKLGVNLFPEKDQTWGVRGRFGKRPYFSRFFPHPSLLKYASGGAILTAVMK